jgi:hypothetical protein
MDRAARGVRSCMYSGGKAKQRVAKEIALAEHCVQRVTARKSEVCTMCGAGVVLGAGVDKAK